jgi:phosphomevalonate kinase
VTLASAPGKVLWAGEYAVLDGHTAVVCAVDRRAIVRRVDAAGPLSPFLEALRVELDADAPGSGDALRRMRVDTSALAQGGRKLGIGSSAAAVVAAAAAVLGVADRARLHAVAHRAHARAQAPRGARGSGADVAASVHGGLLRLARLDGADDDTPLVVTPIPRPPPPTSLLWTGSPADTPSLVARVRALRSRDPNAHAACISRLGAVARDLAAALERGDASAGVAAIAAGADALSALADAAGAALVPPAFAAVRSLAARYQGAAKPTGAGGGDLLLCVFADPDARAAFDAAARAAGMIPLALAVSLQGAVA